MTVAETLIPTLAGSAVPRAELAEADIDAMLALFQESLIATRQIFVLDLANKDCVILLRDGGSGTSGFLDPGLYETEALGSAERGYSCDTIIRPAVLARRSAAPWIKTVLGERHMTQPCTGCCLFG